MTDLISRDAAKAAIPRGDHSRQELLALLDRVPAVDAVEVVRCKECVHLLQDLSIRKYHTCMRYRLPQRVDLDDFCSYGERRNDDAAD